MLNDMPIIYLLYFYFYFFNIKFDFKELKSECQNLLTGKNLNAWYLLILTVLPKGDMGDRDSDLPSHLVQSCPSPDSASKPKTLCTSSHRPHKLKDNLLLAFYYGKLWTCTERKQTLFCSGPPWLLTEQSLCAPFPFCIGLWALWRQHRHIIHTVYMVLL